MSILSVIIILLLIIFFYFWIGVLNIYEVDYKVISKEKYISTFSDFKIDAIPINSFGKRVPFKIVESELIVIEGNELVKIIDNGKLSGRCILKTNEQPGKVLLKFKSNYSLCPSIKEINIQKKFTN